MRSTGNSMNAPESTRTKMSSSIALPSSVSRPTIGMYTWFGGRAQSSELEAQVKRPKPSIAEHATVTSSHCHPPTGDSIAPRLGMTIMTSASSGSSGSRAMTTGISRVTGTVCVSGLLRGRGPPDASRCLALARVCGVIVVLHHPEMRRVRALWSAYCAKTVAVSSLYLRGISSSLLLARGVSRRPRACARPCISSYQPLRPGPGDTSFLLYRARIDV